MVASDIIIKGAREHNLRDVDLVLPRNQLICFTGVSGSGKSSLAFDTLYAEGQRRYVESLSSFARQFLGQMPKPDVDFISGLSPSISISQKTSGQNPRSTVGTITEIYDYLRVLFARAGQGHCPNCDRPITAQSREQIIERIAGFETGTQFLVLAPLVQAKKGEYRDLFVDLLKQGFARARVDGQVVGLTDELRLDRQMRHHIEVVVDRLVAGPTIRSRLAEAVELALRLGEGNLIVAIDAGPASIESQTKGRRKPRKNDLLPAAVDPDFDPDDDSVSGQSRESGDASETSIAGAAESIARSYDDTIFSAHYACTHCGLSFETPTPQLFSFNSPQGMCRDCDGLGEIYGFEESRLISDADRSFKDGCIELIGPWKDMGRWRRHIFQGVADSMERRREIDSGTMLETPWRDLSPDLQKLWLWGTGDEHITFTWRNGAHGKKYGGRFEGIIPQLLSRYRAAGSSIQRRQLEKYMSVVRCATCNGARLGPQGRSVKVATTNPKFADKPLRSLPEVCGLSVQDAAEFFSQLELDATGQTIAAELLKEIRGRLGFLVNVGLEYLALDRTAPTLSGGESQRIRLAGQIGCGLVGVLYILDEPSIGLHPRDNQKLLDTLTQLRDKGNTVVVVEHDEDTMRAADTILDFGPGPGVRGGELVAHGPATTIAKSARSLTGQYLSGKVKIEVPATRRLAAENSATGEKWRLQDWNAEAYANATKGRGRFAPATPPPEIPADSAFASPTIRIVGARHNNLRNVDVEIPLGAFVCVTGASGSGKSSLVNDILVEALRRDLNGGLGNPGDFDRIEGLGHLDKLIAIDQSPIGRTPRSNPSTYIKVFDDIRSLYAKLAESKARGYKPGRFSFNVSGGRCEACEGNGSTRLEMDFLADVWVTCPVCSGHRFNRETLQVRFKGQSIADVLEMDIQQAVTHFENVPDVRHKLQTLHDVGLDYLKLGQPSPTLSGGEAQRIKLARELVKKSTGRTLYLLDEPTTGLHFADIQMLLKVLHDFVDAGNTVLVVEHNLDVIKTADWIIDLGPEGGSGGGRIIATGTPEHVAQQADSHTGQALAPYLDPERQAKLTKFAEMAKPRKPATPESKAIIVRGARQHNLKGVDVVIPRDQMTVCCGLSGSGKSSLAMDTIYAEGQRRYVESLSSYARQFVGQMQKPKLDHIEGLSPAIAIEQKHMGHTPRSTVGTVTEIYDYLRVLMARLGVPYCPSCDLPIGTQSADEIIDKIMAEPEGMKLYLLAPLDVQVGEKYETLWEDLRATGYPRVRIDRETFSVDEPPNIDRRRKHLVELVIDRIVVRADIRSRIGDSVETALSKGKGVLHIAYPADDVPEAKWRTEIHSQHFACDHCGRSFEPLTPHSFSFNSPLGWCPSCEGLGTQSGANPAALLHDPKLSLAQGAVAIFPPVGQPMFAAMLVALSTKLNVPADVPFDQLSARQRRTIMHGGGDDWIDVPLPGEPVAAGSRAAAQSPLWFRFQYKGLYPALEEAARLSAGLRGKLDHLVGEVECSTCDGSRLRDDAASVRLRGRTVADICRTPLGNLAAELAGWQLNPREQKIAGELVREILARVRFLVDVGLEYLSLGRPAPTLSGGESQRIRLASQVGSGLCGVLYVLDEPTIGLHPRDNRRLLTALERLRDLGNTLLIVEHDREVVKAADQLLDFGPAAGEFGGQIVARGTPAQVAKTKYSVTGPYLSGKKAIPIPTNRRMAALPESIAKSKKPRASKKAGAAAAQTALSLRARAGARAVTSALATPPGGGWLEIVGARHNNLRNVTVAIPLGTFTAVTGVSGSGKSSLIEDVLYNSLAKTLHRARLTPAPHDAIRGIERVNKVIRVDQQPLGSTPTSNPATYTGVFDLIRELFAQLPEAKIRGYMPRRFSFNAPGGRCEACEGNGQKRIEMHFLPDVWVECDVCRGRRYNPETLSVHFHGQSIADVLEMSCARAVKLFENIPKIRRILQTLCDVGLDYLTLGQPAPTLSGGEAQRVKLAAELSRPDTGATLFLLDEPTTGLHFDDVAKLLDVLNRLVDLGNTVVVIEHNLDVIKTADWLIDMGPEAGDGGGYVVAAGLPEAIVRSRETEVGSEGNGERPKRSYTAEALAPVLEAGPYAERRPHDFTVAEAPRERDMDIQELGRAAQMPWEIDGRRWHTQERVCRTGEPCRWDGQILAKVVDRIHELGKFTDTNWDSRSVVEISALKKSDGWFLHAITGEQWLLKLKFRCARATFKREDLVSRLGLKPLNEMHHLPVYGADPRVKCKNLRGPWQEVQVSVHALEELDHSEFWKFVEQAVAGFQRFTHRAETKPEDIMPWKVLGQKWHFSRKGFPPSKRMAWEVEVLEELCEMLSAAAPTGQFLWNNQQVVHMFVPGQREPWATIHTKRLASVDLQLTGPKGRFALGRLASFGSDRGFDGMRSDVDHVKLSFQTLDDLARDGLSEFFSEHVATLSSGLAKAAI